MFTQEFADQLIRNTHSAIIGLDVLLGTQGNLADIIQLPPGISDRISALKNELLSFHEELQTQYGK